MKGADWERDICKYLSKWIQGTTKPYLLWRGRGSGAMFTNDDLIGEAFSGDIYSVKDEGKVLTNYVSIECKNGYPQTSLDNHLKYNKKDFLKSFWEQTITDAEKSQKFPMLVYKKKGLKPWLGISVKLFKLFSKEISNLRHLVVHYNSLPDMYLVSFEKFFDLVDINTWKEKLCID